MRDNLLILDTVLFTLNMNIKKGKQIFFLSTHFSNFLLPLYFNPENLVILNQTYLYNFSFYYIYKVLF